MPKINPSVAHTLPLAGDHFEAALRAGRKPRIEEFLPADPGERCRLLLELVQTELAYRVEAGERRLIGGYLQRFPELARDADAVVLLIAAEYRVLRRLEPAAPLEEYLTRYPRFADRLRALFTDEPPRAVPIEVPGYEILGVLGKGGMGVVYQARDRKLKRVVALKMILSGSHADEADLARFRTEAEAIARLQHPNIVQIYEVGEQQGLPFLTLEFCAGGSLEKRLNGTPLPAADASPLVETLARAVHAAHTAGILHRDLKPANVLLAGDGTPKVTDFGLAKKLDEVGQTQSNAVVGTPSYMAPEQAGSRNRTLGPTADVYALGVILYECLTGRPPFRAATPLETLLQVMHDEPVAPRLLNPKTPRDLETIALMAMAKEPGRRYATAQELADDLRAYAEGRPIRARPVGLVGRAWRWTRRNPAAAALLLVGGVAALAVVALGVGLRYNATLARSLQSEAEARQTLETTVGELNTAQAAQKAAADSAERFSYFHRIGLAHSLWAGGELPRALYLLQECPEPHRNWEWHYLNGLCHSELAGFDLGESYCTGLAFSPDGRRLAGGGYLVGLRVWEPDAGTVLLKLETPDRTGPDSVLYSPDGKRLVSVDRGVSIMRDPAGKELYRVPGTFLGFTPDGGALLGTRQRPAAGRAEKRDAIGWDAATGKETFSTPLQNSETDDFTLALSPDGKRLVGIGQRRTVHIWDARTGAIHLEPDAAVASPYAVPSRLGDHDRTPVAFSPDGRLFAGACRDSAVNVWDAATGRRLTVLRGHLDVVHTLVFSPDGRRLASASRDRTVRLWDADAGVELDAIHGHGREVVALAFSPDGARLATASYDTRVKIWDMSVGQAAVVLPGPPMDFVQHVSFTPDGRRIAALGDRFSVWDAATGAFAPRLPVTAYGPVVPGLNGRYIAAPQADGGLAVIDLTESRLSHTIPLVRKDVAKLEALSADGRRVAVVRPDRAVAVVDDRGTEVCRLTLPRGAGSVAFSPDGTRLVTTPAPPDTEGRAFAGKLGDVVVWDAQSGAEVVRFPWNVSGIFQPVFSPDGHLLVVPDSFFSTVILDVRTGKRVHVLRTDSGGAVGVAFSPDSERLATVAKEGVVTLHDVTTGYPLLTLNRAPNDPPSRSGVFQFSTRLAAFSPDGRWLATAAHGGIVKLWGVAPTREPAARQATWHAAEAEDSEAARQWFAAAFHRSRVLEARPNDSRERAHRALAYLRLGRVAEARADLQRAGDARGEAELLAYLRKELGQ